MITLFFGNAITIINTFMVLTLLAFAAYAFVEGASISKWGRLVALFLILGTAVSALSATRDGFGTAYAQFAMASVQSLICSVAGGIIYLIALVSIFIKKQGARRVCFHAMTILFTVQVVVVEASRIIAATGGAV